jgi:excisionase family DNA binding protein
MEPLEIVSHDNFILRFEPVTSLRRDFYPRCEKIVVPKKVWTAVAADPFELLPMPAIAGERLIDVSSSRADVTAIWPPRSKSTEQCLPGAKTLPGGFAQPSWSIEHVLAWIGLRNIDALAGLESTHAHRPAFYGTLCASGYFDEGASSDLVAALADGSLRGRQGTHTATYDGRRDYLTAETNQGVWFVQADILARWPAGGSSPASVGHADLLRKRKMKAPASRLNATSTEPERTRQQGDASSWAAAGGEDSRDAVPATISVRHACELSGLGRTTVYKEISAGRIRSTKVGSRRLVIRQSLMEFLSLHQVKSTL